MNNFKIALLEVPQNLPSWVYSPDGNVYFDINPETVISRTSSAEILTDFNKITGDAVLGFSLSVTNKNYAILKDYINPSGYYYPNAYFLRVQAIKGCFILEQDYLEILSVGTKWEVELSNQKNHWKTLLENRTINECKYPVFRLTRENVNATYDLNPIFQDGNLEVFFSLWHNGNWRKQLTEYDDEGKISNRGRAGIEDLVPVYYILPMLKKIFALEGYKFFCPALENDWGRSLAMRNVIDLEEDIPPQSFGFKAVVLDNYTSVEVDASNSGGILTENPDYWVSNSASLQAIDDHTLGYDGAQDEDYIGFYRTHLDYNDNNTTTKPYYATGLSGRFKISGKIYISNREFNESEIYVSAVVYDAVPENSNTIFYNSPQVKTDAGLATIEFEHIFTCEPDKEVTVKVFLDWAEHGDTGLFYVLKNSYWEMTPIEVEFSENMILPLSKILRADKCTDFIKGCVHLFGPGKLVTDWLNKTVTLLTPHSTDVYDYTRPMGYYKQPEKSIDISNLIECDSEVNYAPEVIDYNSYVIGFMTTTDKYLKDLGYNKEVKPYGISVEGNEFAPKLEIKTSENPYFEPTGNKYAIGIVADGHLPPELPVALDNTTNKISKDIKPRIVCVQGRVRQYAFNDGDFLQYRKFRWLEGESDLIPWVTQLSQQGIGENNVRPKHSITYGQDVFNLWEFWEQDFLDNIKGIGITIQADISDNFFSKRNFRTLYKYFNNGRELTLKLLQVSAQTGIEGKLATLKFISPYRSLNCNKAFSSAVNQFMQCDFYMDFSEHITEQTLEGMMLVKFDVNGQDMIGGANIQLMGPITKIGNYVTNLPDFLNSIGVPSFTFSYAGQTQKKFSIKWPVGVDFEIIIEALSNGQDMYRWTPEAHFQGTFWGLPSWTAYAYEQSPYPTNCIIVDE